MGGQGGTDRKLTGPGGRGEGKDSALEGGGVDTLVHGPGSGVFSGNLVTQLVPCPGNRRVN